MAVWFIWQWPHSLVREASGAWRMHGPRGRRRLGWKLTMATSWALAVIWPGPAPGRWGHACRRRALLWWWDPVFDGLRRLGLALLAWMWPANAWQRLTHLPSWRRRIPAGSVAALIMGVAAVASPNPVQRGEGELTNGRSDQPTLSQNDPAGDQSGGQAGGAGVGADVGDGFEGGGFGGGSAPQQLAQLTGSTGPTVGEGSGAGGSTPERTPDNPPSLPGTPEGGTTGDFLATNVNGGSVAFGGGSGGGVGSLGGEGAGGGGAGGAGAGGGGGGSPGGSPGPNSSPGTQPQTPARPTGDPSGPILIDTLNDPFPPGLPFGPQDPFTPADPSQPEPGDGPVGSPTLIGPGWSPGGGPGGGSPRDETAVDTRLAPIPEPSTWLTMILGFGALGAVLRCRRQRILRG